MFGATKTSRFGDWQDDLAGGSPGAACIIRIDDNVSNALLQGKYMILPFFPESLSDSKGVNWNTVELPGASHPIYQFVSGGERTLTFTAKLIRETKPKQAMTLPDGEQTDLRSPFNVDINYAVRFLRSCIYPRMRNQGTVMQAPCICKVKVGGARFAKNERFTNCVMTQCDVEVTKWWDDNNTTPRVAEVSLAFAELINVFGGVTYIQAHDLDSSVK